MPVSVLLDMSIELIPLALPVSAANPRKYASPAPLDDELANATAAESPPNIIVVEGLPFVVCWWFKFANSISS